MNEIFSIFNPDWWMDENNKRKKGDVKKLNRVFYISFSKTQYYPIT